MTSNGGKKTSSIVDRLQVIQSEQADVICLAKTGHHASPNKFLRVQKVKRSSVLESQDNVLRDWSLDAFGLNDDESNEDYLYQGLTSKIVYTSEGKPVNKFFSFDEASWTNSKEYGRRRRRKREGTFDESEPGETTEESDDEYSDVLDEVDEDSGIKDITEDSLDSDRDYLSTESKNIKQEQDVAKMMHQLDIHSAAESRAYFGFATGTGRKQPGKAGTTLQAAYNVYASGQDLRPWPLDMLKFHRDSDATVKLCQSDRISDRTRAILNKNIVRASSNTDLTKDSGACRGIEQVSVSHTLDDLTREFNESDGLGFLRGLSMSSYQKRSTLILRKLMRLALVRNDKELASRIYACLIRSYPAAPQYTQTYSKLIDIRYYWTLGLEIIKFRYQFTPRVAQEFLEWLILQYPITRASKANTSSTWKEFQASAMYPELFQLRLQTQLNPLQVRSQIENLLYSKEYEDVAPLYLVQCLAILRSADFMADKTNQNDGLDPLDELKETVTKTFLQYANLVDLAMEDRQEWLEVLVAELEQSRAP